MTFGVWQSGSGGVGCLGLGGRAVGEGEVLGGGRGWRRGWSGMERERMYGKSKVRGREEQCSG